MKKFFVLLVCSLVLAGCNDEDSRDAKRFALREGKLARLHWDAKWEAQTICARNNMLYVDFTYLQDGGRTPGEFRAKCFRKDGTIAYLKRTDQP